MKRIRHARIRFSLLLLGLLLLAADGLLLLSGARFGGAPLTDQTEAHFIDVGQGDATLLLSGGEAVLIDAGEAGAGETVAAYLQNLGVKRLLAVVATHPHADHIGGLPAVLDSLEVENFYMGGDVTNTQTYGNLLDTLERHSLRPIVPAPGDTLSFSSGAELTFLGPYDDVPDDNLNDRSLLCLFRAGDTRVLLMGDAEKAAEDSLMRHHPFLSCDVLKVGHHGSDTSTGKRFLSRLRPETAVISCGQDNNYGHPSPQTLKTLSQEGVHTIHITAEEGTVVLPLGEPSMDKENAA